MLFGSEALRKRRAQKVLQAAQSLRREGNLLQALDAYEEASRLGAPAADALLQLAVLNAQLGRSRRALEVLVELLARDPGHADALHMLAVVKYDLGRYAESAAHCDHTLAKRPDLVPAHYTRGLARLGQGDVRGAAASFARCLELCRGQPWQHDAARRLLLDNVPPYEPREMAVSSIKLAHDLEQLEYLLDSGLLPEEFRQVSNQYQVLLGSLPVSEGELVQEFDTDAYPLVARTYKRPVHLSEEAAPRGPVLNPGADWETAQRTYLGSTPSVAVLDGLLTDEALRGLRRYCLESTLWNDIKPGYLGTYLDEGFASEILLRISTELRERLPLVIRDHPLQSLWAYKYDSSLPGVGIGVHADAAAVNVNFWITEDEANLDPEHGGLLVYARKAPKDWTFSKFNTDWESIIDFLEADGQAPLRIPYRANRAVIFDSDLFHVTDAPRFRTGYVNRRINVTLLYGQRVA